MANSPTPVNPIYKMQLDKATLSKVSAEMKLAGALLYFQASCFGEDEEAQEKIRLEIHVLQDIILDATHIITRLAMKNIRANDQ